MLRVLMALLLAAVSVLPAQSIPASSPATAALEDEEYSPPEESAESTDSTTATTATTI